MEHDPGPGDRPVTGNPHHDAIQELREHVERVQAARSSWSPRSSGATTTRSGRQEHAALVADLEVVTEELRVADDELRAQQEHLTSLAETHARLREEHDQMLSALPVPAVVTDAAGVIRSANPAMATLAQVRLDRMIGKPVFTFFDLDQRAGLRRRVAAQARDGQPFRHRAEVLTRHGSRAPVEISAAVLPGLGPEVCWMLVADVGRVSLTAVAGQVLPGVLVRLAALPADHETLQGLIGDAVVLCREALGDDVQVSVSIGSPSRPEAVASTDTVAQQLDGAQLAHAEGPCIDAFEQSVTIVSEDVRTDPRWPGIADAVPDAVGAVVATSLTGDGRRVGALNVYRTRPGSDLPLVETTELLASTLSAVLHEHAVKSELRATASGMQAALDSRAVIDQAKGIVMADRGCSAEEAFAHLVQLSSQHEVKVRDIARMIVERRSGPLGG